MSLRLIAALLLFLMCAGPVRLVAGDSQAGAIGAGATLVVVKEAADAVKAIGDAIGSLTDGIKKLVSAGDQGWSVISARRTLFEPSW